MPLVTDAPPAMLGNYEILDLPGEENALMYREGHIVDEIVEDRSKIDRYRTAFERYWKAALEPEESARLIENRIQQLTA
jgi:hypothetical protein